MCTIVALLFVCRNGDKNLSHEEEQVLVGSLF